VCAVLNDGPQTYAEIARLTGMTKQRVEQIAKKAMNKIRNHKKIKEIIKEHE
jgi:DNA-directed RNA polymerase sigma subunit (sigma70/sigma32)